MIQLLQQILCAIQAIAYKTIDLLVFAINGLLAAVGAAVTLAIGLLPLMPAEPDPPSSGVLAFLNWLIPLAPMLAAAGAIITVWLAYLGFRVLLNWLKAL